MKKRIFLLIGLLTIAGNVLADGFIVIHNPPHSPRPTTHYEFAPLEVVYHHVNVKIAGQIATTAVDQEFYNPNDQRLEGTYLFPVPAGAQIDKFTMEINGKPVEAELLLADKARSIYEDIVRKMRDPALLEYAGRDVFKVRIFPIEPRSNKRVTLAYTQVLKADNGLVGYLYPLNTEKFSAAPIQDVSVKIELDAKRPLKTIYSPSHSIEIKRHGETGTTIGFAGKGIRPDTDFQVFWQCADKDLGVSLLTYRERGEDGYFLLLAAPGSELKPKQVVKKNIVFVLDTSGSMAGNKLAQAKKALQFCVENLNDADQFEILRFSTETEPVFEKLVDATDKNRQRAREFIKDLKPIGGTALEEALVKALALQPDVVIFLTDGQPTIGTLREEEILASVKRINTGQARVFCFGIGTDVNTHLLDQITAQTRAFSQYVLPAEDIEVKVSNFYTQIKEPVLTNPHIIFPQDVHATKLHPNALPDLFKGEQLVVVGRYTVTAPKNELADYDIGALRIEGTVDGKLKQFDYQLNFPDQASSNAFIPRLWAAQRIGYLLDESRLHGENKELRDEITELARQYGIVTPYTAYLIVEDEGRRNLPVATRSLQDFESDRPVREQALHAWSTFNEQKSGAGAVSGAMASDAFRQVDNIGGLASVSSRGSGGGRGTGGGHAGGDGPAGEANRRALINATPVPAAPAIAERFDQYAQQTRFVNGRAFFQNGTQWMDATVQKLPNARRVQVKFNSDDYFALLVRYAHAAQWFSLGRNIQIALDDVVYEVID